MAVKRKAEVRKAVKDDSLRVVAGCRLIDTRIVRANLVRHVAPEHASHGTYYTGVDVQARYFSDESSKPPRSGILFTSRIHLIGKTKQDRPEDERKSFEVEMVLEAIFALHNRDRPNAVPLSKQSKAFLALQVHPMLVARAVSAVRDMGFVGVRAPLGLDVRGLNILTQDGVDLAKKVEAATA
jgi:hypothetical protein